MDNGRLSSAMLNKRQIRQITRIFDANNKIGKAWLFGSFARGEETKDSDIDILFSFKSGQSFGLIEMTNVIDSLEKTLKRKVDLIKEGTLLSFAVESVNQDKILIYGN